VKKLNNFALSYFIQIAKSPWAEVYFGSNFENGLARDRCYVGPRGLSSVCYFDLILKRGDQKMKPRTQQREDKAFVPMSYMAMELSNRTWNWMFGDSRKRRQVSIEAAVQPMRRRIAEPVLGGLHPVYQWPG